MTTIPQRDLRNHNAQIIERVMAGESFVVTRDGVPVADVTPHVSGNKPPQFRSTADLPPWTPLSSQVAAAWIAEIEGVRDEDNPRDPWERP